MKQNNGDDYVPKLLPDVQKLAGMTGTAKTEEEEFREIYNIQVIQIPTNRPIIRDDRPDLLYPTLESKFNAVVEDIKERYHKGQPVLVGTVAVETSELLSDKLNAAKIPHEVLNAKNHFKEAEIIMNAGQKAQLQLQQIWLVVERILNLV